MNDLKVEKYKEYTVLEMKSRVLNRNNAHQLKFSFESFCDHRKEENYCINMIDTNIEDNAGLSALLKCANLAGENNIKLTFLGLGEHQVARELLEESKYRCKLRFGSGFYSL
jgi:anti-anti-sigma regulatory factor